MSMTQEQAVTLVAYLNRAGLVIAMEGQAAVWRDALYGVRFEDAQEAARELVRAGAVRERFATPADLYRAVRKLRSGRIGGRVPPAPPVPLDAAGEMLFGRTYLWALGSGASEAEADAVACKRVGVVREQLEGPGRDPRELIEATAAALQRPEG
ncbi:hypothetical protein PBI_KEPLER_48 [Arthrobacter phage Kepler]|uniref:Uncharacterized protein n=3 Tax=Coralvirus TaxID=2733171 RepID=A0A5J6TTB1_9CAUD|nr:hypothetical protein HOU55_gp48 [Arthrobacter phage Kepler]AYN58275.1 hypothetical protein PBI_KEPLER_48 [Arthrobacter phage Kepler]AYN58803.1 hypothetical protein PBI_POLKA_47 [Arthrobacter phage Polka]QFG13099.1 hypothetical protein PBI_AMELIA_47 [Arthrobacter phage Amelia]